MKIEAVKGGNYVVFNGKKMYDVILTFYFLWFKIWTEKAFVTEYVRVSEYDKKTPLFVIYKNEKGKDDLSYSLSINKYFRDKK